MPSRSFMNGKKRLELVVVDEYDGIGDDSAGERNGRRRLGILLIGVVVEVAGAAAEPSVKSSIL